MKLLVQGEKVCFDISVEMENYNFLAKLCSKGLIGASCVKEDIDWYCVFDSTSENKKNNRITV